MHFIYRLIPFFFHLVKKQGLIFFIGVNSILLKSFKSHEEYAQQASIIFWKGGLLSRFFCQKLWLESKGITSKLVTPPICFIFLNLDNYLNVFKELSNYKLPIIGLFDSSANPSLIYSFGEMPNTFFINCFFFKLFSRVLKHLN